MMIIEPSVGMALILEDKKDFGGSEFSTPDSAKKGVGTTGVIVSVTNVMEEQPTLYFEALMGRCPEIDGLPKVVRDILEKFCGEMERGHEKINQYAIGDHVIFSKFNEQICVYEDGKEKIYYSVPVQSILGKITYA